MPQTDITLFFNQVFVLILVFFFLLSFLSKYFLKSLSLNLFFRHYLVVFMGNWISLFRNYDLSIAYYDRIFGNSLFFGYSGEINRLELYNTSLNQVFLFGVDNINYSPNYNYFYSIANLHTLNSITLDENKN